MSGLSFLVSQGAAAPTLRRVSEQNRIAEDEWIAVARLLRPQGRRGEVLAEPLSDLEDLFAVGKQLWLSTGADTKSPKPGTEPRVIESSWRPSGRNAGRVVLKLAGVDSIDAAEALAQATAWIPAADMPALDADRYFVRDLLGAQLWNDSELVGEIEDVEFAVGADGRTRLGEAAPLLVVRLAQPSEQAEVSAPDDAEETVLVPFVRDWISEVDLEDRRVVMRLPAGLVEEARG